jgi:2,3-bisphosphoglycerate-dependent phosphoglycerate mutase
MPPVYLIRHGETAYNAGRILQTPEVPLSGRGIAQARRLAERLAGAGLRRILASDLLRAAMTAHVLADATGAPIETDSLLQERNFGDLRGTPYAALGFDPFAPDYAPPGGESIPAFHARVARAWARIEEVAAATDGPLAVVTHGLVCRDLVARHLELLPGLAAPSDPTRWANTSVTELAGPPWRVRLLACTAHLGGI